MAEILVFPIKKQLPQDVEDTIQEIASSYIKILNYALIELTSEHPSQAELNEVKGLVELSYAKALYKAIDNLGEES